MDDEKLESRFEVDKLILRLRTTVPGERSAITPVVDQIMKIATEMGCAKGKESEIELVLQEALANAVVHGCREDPGKEVQIWVGCDESRGMIIGVRDPGTGFDPTDVPSPLVGERLYASHGRGVYLINQLMDEVRYERNGTEIWMRKQ